MTIKELPASDRPRERLARYGGESLSTIELLAILLGSGTRSRSCMQLASDLLAHFGSLYALAEASLVELQKVKGIGKAKAIQLKASFALFSRIEERPAMLRLEQPRQVYDLIRVEFSTQKIEVLMVVLLDVRNVCIHREIIAKGTLTELLMHPREIFHVAIRHQAHRLIIAHNHPSGDPSPSQRDIDMTRLLIHAGKVVGIELTDHLIIGKNTYFSFQEKGLIKL